MKIKPLQFISIALFFLFSLNLNAASLNELRAQYMIALHNEDKVEDVYNTFLKVENPSGKILGYRAALEAIMTKTTWNIFKKISYLKLSEASFKEAVRKSPKDLEVRFMRLAVQFEIPEYLGFSSNKEEDKKYIIENINNFDISNLPKQTIKEIYGFMVRCNYFTENQMQKFKNHLELN